MISKEAQDVSVVFGKLREEGFWVYNFNTNRPQRKATAKLCDHLIIGEHGIDFIEVKLRSTKDKPTANQRLFRELIKRLARRSSIIRYWDVVELSEAIVIQEQIKEHR